MPSCTRMPLLTVRPQGLFCPQGGFYVDPWRPVPRAVITHAHSDHARSGCGKYLAHTLSVPVMRLRLGQTIDIEGLEYGRVVHQNGVAISLHPAGHILGSAQVRLEYGGEVWVVSGDYKLEDDQLTTPFEPVRCETLITECTFGLPVYCFPPQGVIAAELVEWCRAQRDVGRAACIQVYSLGKAQRVAALLAAAGVGPLYGDLAVCRINEIFRSHGVSLPEVREIEGLSFSQRKQGVTLRSTVPTDESDQRDSWAMVSGWMLIRKLREQRAAALGVPITGFALSDHADWEGLRLAVRESGAPRVITTHGYTSAFSRYLAGQGIESTILHTAGGGASSPDIVGEDQPVEHTGTRR